MASLDTLLGDPKWLSATTTPIKIALELTGKHHVGHFKIADQETVLQHISTRAEAIVVSDISIFVSGPQVADKATSALAVITSSSNSHWPTKFNSVRKAVYAQRMKESLYQDTQFASHKFHPSISRQLKPKPLLQHEPEIVYAVQVAGGDKDTVTTVEIEFDIKLAGEDYVCPWTSSD